eukprot:TRINITY_DN3314_c4_g5_i1.p1 TRINITY_DN3314_c4_g5~~TRINITY_DN3314_c4_g5_i1.p1  ORF type:complete len:987 (-),score=287.03 TRINITY_DN3314_c4_g5_i1:112-3072(-)
MNFEVSVEDLLYTLTLATLKRRCIDFDENDLNSIYHNVEDILTLSLDPYDIDSDSLIDMNCIVLRHSTNDIKKPIYFKKISYELINDFGNTYKDIIYILSQLSNYHSRNITPQVSKVDKQKRKEYKPKPRVLNGGMKEIKNVDVSVDVSFEQRVVREVIEAMRGNETKRLHRNKDLVSEWVIEGEEFHKGQIQIIKEILAKTEHIGQVNKSIFDHTKMEGIYNQALFSSLWENVCKKQLNVTNLIETRIYDEEQTVTLLSLHSKFLPIFNTVDCVKSILNVVENVSIESKELKRDILSELIEICKTGNSVHFSIYKTIFESCMVPFFDWTINFLKYGEFVDTNLEYFVQQNLKETRDIWNNRFRIVEGNVPIFFLDLKADSKGKVIVSEVGQKILLLGKTVYFIRKCCSFDSFENKFDTEKLISCFFMKDDFTKVSNHLIEFLLQMETHVNEVIHDQLFKKYNFLQHLQNVKKFLLLEQGDFILSLYEHYSNMSGDVLTATGEYFKACYRDCFKNMTIQQQDRVLDYLAIKVVGNEKKINVDTITLSYDVFDNTAISTILNGDIMVKYSKIFLFLFRLTKYHIKFSQRWTYQRKLGVFIERSMKMFEELKKLSRLDLPGFEDGSLSVLSEKGKKIHKSLVFSSTNLRSSYGKYQMLFNILLQFFNNDIINPRYNEFLADLSKHPNLDTIIMKHNDFVNSLISRMYLTKNKDGGMNDFQLQLNKLLDLAEDLLKKSEWLFNHTTKCSIGMIKLMRLLKACMDGHMDLEINWEHCLKKKNELMALFDEFLSVQKKDVYSCLWDNKGRTDVNLVEFYTLLTKEEYEDIGDRILLQLNFNNYYSTSVNVSKTKEINEIESGEFIQGVFETERTEEKISFKNKSEVLKNLKKIKSNDEFVSEVKKEKEPVPVIEDEISLANDSNKQYSISSVIKTRIKEKEKDDEQKNLSIFNVTQKPELTSTEFFKIDTEPTSKKFSDLRRRIQNLNLKK